MTGRALRIGARAACNLAPLLKEALWRPLVRCADEQFQRRLHAPLPLHIGELYQRQLPRRCTESTRDLQLAPSVVRPVREEERLCKRHPQSGIRASRSDGLFERRELLAAPVSEPRQLPHQHMLNGLRGDLSAHRERLLVRHRAAPHTAGRQAAGKQQQRCATKRSLRQSQHPKQATRRPPSAPDLRSSHGPSLRSNRASSGSFPPSSSWHPTRTSAAAGCAGSPRDRPQP